MTYTPMGLPPMWDGADVEWRAWDRSDDIFVCSRSRKAPARDVCERCRSTKPQLMNAGRASSGPDWQGVATYRLFAFRCPDCHLDTVWDMRADEWWTLGPEDYGDAGSHDPRLPAVPRLSCLELWPAEAPLMRGSLRPTGRLVVTDRHLALYVDQLTDCADVAEPRMMTRREAFRVTGLLCLCPTPVPSTEVFQARYLDPIEAAGYVVRPLFGAAFAHGLVHAGRVHGVLMPVHPAESHDVVRTVAA